MITLILIAILGAVGSLVRFHFGGYVHLSVNSALGSEAHFPFGTLFVNVTGCFILGMLAGLSMYRDLAPFALLVLGTGFCGALTTFSTLAVDVQRFLRDRRYIHAVLDLGLSLFAGIGATWAGFVLTTP
ncbi:MAG: CrcB family protein [Chthoniobacterales bacterium]